MELGAEKLPTGLMPMKFQVHSSITVKVPIFWEGQKTGAKKYDPISRLFLTLLISDKIWRFCQFLVAFSVWIYI